MPAQASLSPIAAAALALLGNGATPTDLVSRLAAVEATVDEVTAKGRLDELCALGLARAIAGNDRTTYYMTPLGERVLGMSFAANPEHVDLLAEIERMRTEILTTIAHELRTPLTAVRTSVGLLLDPTVEPNAAQQRALLETVDRNAIRMQRVVADILDMARFRSGQVQLQLRRFDAAELARTAVASVAPLAQSRHQPIEVAASPDPAFVYGDARRLEQALVNLLSNAVKYSPDGAPIRVTVSSSAGEVSWSITDRGHGIRPDDRARLFERFFVARRDRTEASAGIGLGLPIALLIVQAHGGRIEVESRPGRGSTFRVTVPTTGPEESTGQ
jgi:signal transduction histidine kinase